MKPGGPALTVVGTGIRWGTDLTANVRRALAEAEDVFYLASDTISRSVLLQLRPDALSLGALYGDEVDRHDTYEAMVERVLERVRAGRRVCFAIPGHPGVFANPTHEAVRRARAEGYSAVMLPALSAVDHLYADLGVDPGEPGSSCFDATDFVIYGRRADPTVALILFQIGAIGETCNPRVFSRDGLELLTEILIETYSGSHEVVVYEAARYAFSEPRILRVQLVGLAAAAVPLISTLYVPPASAPTAVPERLLRLGLMAISA